MRIIRLAKEGAKALLTHKLRAFFMMAGTLIGVMALTAITTISVGTARKLKQQLSKWPHDVIKVNVGGGKGYTMPQEGITTLLPTDAEAIQDQIDNLVLVTSVAEKRGLSIKGNSRQIGTNVFSIQPNWHEVMNWHIEQGESVTDEDIATMARVCVLGATIKEELFGEQDPIGEMVQVGNVRLRIKGVLKPRGVGTSGRASDDRILVPLSTGLRRLFNQEHLSYIRMTVRDPDEIENTGETRIERTAEEVRQLLHERHHITPPQEDDFSIVYASIVIKEIRSISKTATVLLIVLAGLSLVVGGIVMMNIMLVSVNERTNEIGLKRALGATRGDIFIQFLNESLIVTVVGIVIGGILGWIVSILLAKYRDLSIGNSWELFALIVLFALLIGIFSGVQPARRAAKLQPVETLR
jgi:putative ABC transport system permease protein